MPHLKGNRFHIVLIYAAEVQNVIDQAQEILAAYADIFEIWRCCGLKVVRSRRSVIPITRFIGVRISWLIFAGIRLLLDRPARGLLCVA